MDGIKIEVTGNIARVIERPARITSGTVGLPVEFTFDNDWTGLRKQAVFCAGNVTKTVDSPDAETTVPWEVLEKPGRRLLIGVIGSTEDGTIVIPTVWANVCVIHVGTSADGDPSADPTMPFWKQMADYYAELAAAYMEAKKTSPAIIGEVTLLASKWAGSVGLYWQKVEIDGVSENSQVDLTPSVEQLAIFHQKDLAFVAENDGGEVTVYAIGEKPTNDYTMQVTITEVYV